MKRFLIACVYVFGCFTLSKWIVSAALLLYISTQYR